MRKHSVTFMLMLLILMCVFADSASSSLEVSAFKEAPLPDLTYTINVKDYTKSQSGSAISGISNLYDVSSPISSSRTIAKAFSIEVSSNLKSTISIGLRFTPLVNQDDKSIKVPVTYSFSATDLNQVAGSTYYTSTKKGNTTTYYYARFTPSFKIGGNTTGSYDIAQDASYTLVFNPAETVQTGTTTRTNRTPTNWATATMPSTTGNTLPGIGTKVVSGTANFGLSVSEADYEAMRANTDHVTTVTVTISSL